MDDNLISDLVAPDGGDDQNSGGDEAKKRKQKRYWKAARIMAFFGMIEAFSLVLWSKSEDFSPHAAYFVRWAGDCGLLAGGGYLAHKLTGEKFKRWIIGIIWFSWVIVCVVMFFAKSTESKPAPAPAVITVPQPDYIEGTEITHKQIEELFPFGHAVIYLNDAGEKQIHEFHNKLMDWKIDWDAVKIEPNVSAGTVLVSVQLAGSGMPGKFNGPNVGMTIPFKTGRGGPLGVILGNNPVPYAIVLSDNQRSPVFAIGFRITAQDELNHKNQ